MSKSVSENKNKRLVGIIAIILIIILAVLGIAGLLSWFEWVVGALFISIVANLILRRIGNSLK